MKWKLTGRYLLSVLVIVLAVTFVNLIILLGIFFNQQFADEEGYPAETGEQFTRSFEKYLSIENDHPTVSEAGKQALKDFGGWLQILDEDGYVVENTFAPKDATEHYRPFDIVQSYKYRDDELNTYYVGEFESYTYLIAVTESDEERVVFTFHPKTLTSALSKAFLSITAVDLLIAVVIGLLFSIIIMKPVNYMIDRIHLLKERNFKKQQHKTQGVFKPVFANLDDVTDAMREHEKERKKLEEMREEWINNVSHDLKTPLSSVQGFSELLKDENLSAEDRIHYAEIIEEKSLYMRELLDDFRLTMQLQEGNFPLELKETDMVSFVREVVIDLLNDPAFKESSIEFKADVLESKWAIDSRLMKRAILNLMTNTFIHNDPDVELTVEVKDNMIRLTDNGKGMPAADAEQIFSRYYRGTNTEDIKGTGLGLAIAKDIIEAHSGQIVLTTEENKGTTFTITYDAT